jgi:hypothetical protein
VILPQRFYAAHVSSKRIVRNPTPAAVCALVFISSVAAADQIYQCRDTVGRVTFSNVPCEGAPPHAKAEEGAKYAAIQLISSSVLTEKPGAYSITAILRR